VPRLFVDTSFHVAIFSDSDQLHDRAIAISDEFSLDSSVRFVTAEAVLVEFLTFVRRAGPRTRQRAADYVAELRLKPGVSIAAQTRELFERGLELYRSRPDKNYSMTDCMSMVVCRERGIADVLTYDRDFEQEGFVALLRGV
jgi:uncharacterized protein